MDPGMPYGKYLEILFGMLQEKLIEMGTNENMARFVIDEFVNTGVGEVEKVISEFGSERCKSVQAKPRVTDSYCLTGPELMP